MCSHHTAMETLNLIMNSQGLHICRPAGRHRPPNRAVSVVCSMGTGLLWANQRARTHARRRTCSSSVQLQRSGRYSADRGRNGTTKFLLFQLFIGKVRQLHTRASFCCCTTVADTMAVSAIPRTDRKLWTALLVPSCRQVYLRAHESDKLENGTVPSRAASSGVYVHNQRSGSTLS